VVLTCHKILSHLPRADIFPSHFHFQNHSPQKWRLKYTRIKWVFKIHIDLTNIVMPGIIEKFLQARWRVSSPPRTVFHSQLDAKVAKRKNSFIQFLDAEKICDLTYGSTSSLDSKTRLGLKDFFSLSVALTSTGSSWRKVVSKPKGLPSEASSILNVEFIPFKTKLLKWKINWINLAFLSLLFYLNHKRQKSKQNRLRIILFVCLFDIFIPIFNIQGFPSKQSDLPISINL